MLSITNKEANLKIYTFVKTTNIPNYVKSILYIKWHDLSRTRHVKSPDNSIRFNYQKFDVQQEDLKS